MCFAIRQQQTERVNGNKIVIVSFAMQARNRTTWITFERVLSWVALGRLIVSVKYGLCNETPLKAGKFST